MSATHIEPRIARLRSAQLRELQLRLEAAPWRVPSKRDAAVIAAAADLLEDLVRITAPKPSRIRKA